MKRHAALVPLSRQHHDGLALGVFIERGLRPGAGPGEPERLRQQVLDAWELELKGHFKVEEQVLFPAVRDAIPDPSAVDLLIREHQEIRELIGSVRDAKDDGLKDVLLEVRSVLTRHIRTEERVLFEAVQDSLDETDLSALGQQIDEALPKACVRLGSAQV